jgi:hypothetical protein
VVLYEEEETTIYRYWSVHGEGIPMKYKFIKADWYWVISTSLVCIGSPLVDKITAIVTWFIISGMTFLKVLELRYKIAELKK